MLLADMGYQEAIPLPELGNIKWLTLSKLGTVAWQNQRQKKNKSINKVPKTKDDKVDERGCWYITTNTLVEK